MLKVGILVPYVKNEIALAATQLADWLVRCGINVSLLSNAKIEKGVHDFWDSRVRRAKKHAVYKWAYGSTHLCWFDSDIKALKASRLVTNDEPLCRTKMLFFPNWRKWNINDDHFLMQADRVVSLNRELGLWLERHRPVDDLQIVTRTYVNMPPPATILIPKKGVARPDQLKLLVIIPKDTPMDIDDGFVDMLEDTLLALPNLKIKIVSERSLPTSYRSKIKRLRKIHTGRAEYDYSLPYYQYLHEARKHDWVYVANTRHIFGTLASQLLESTVPIIAHDVPPVGCHLNDKINSRLIPCNLIESPYPVADVDLDQVATHLIQFLYDTNMYIKGIQRTGFELLSHRQNTFEKFVYREFVDYTTPGDN